MPRHFSAILITSSAVSAACAGEVYFHHMGSPSGGSNTQATAMTADGTLVVGHAQDIAASRYRAFQWTWDSGFIWLDDPTGNWDNVFVRDVSDDGRVIVGTAASSDGTTAPIVWQDGVPASIGYLPGGNSAGGGAAWGVSSNGLLVVGQSSSAEGMQAYSWTNGVFTALGFLEPTAANFSRAYAVSGDGSVIVGESTSSRGSEAVRWQDGVIATIGDLPGGIFSGLARSVTSDGSVIAGRGLSEAGYREFRWNDGTMIDLGGIPGGEEYHEPSGISSDGAVIGGYGYALVGEEVLQTAIVWDSVLGMRALKDVLFDDFAISLGDFALYEVSGVSADGHTLVGYGAIPRTSSHAWIARIEYRCRVSDLDFDFQTGLADLTLFLAHFGECSGDATYFRPADLDRRGCVDLADLTILLTDFGTICP